MKLQIDFYGELTDITSANRLEYPISNSIKLMELINQLHTQFPGISEIEYSIFKDNTQISDKEMLLHQNDRICLMPAFAGG